MRLEFLFVVLVLFEEDRPSAAAIPAASGPAAFAVAPSFLPDAVVLDIGLPKMDGYKVVQRPPRQPGSTTTWSKR